MTCLENQVSEELVDKWKPSVTNALLTQMCYNRGPFHSLILDDKTRDNEGRERALKQEKEMETKNLKGFQMIRESLSDTVTKCHMGDL